MKSKYRQQLKKEIEKLKTKLHQVSQNKKMTKRELLEISQDLDGLINK